MGSVNNKKLDYLPILENNILIGVLDKDSIIKILNQGIKKKINKYYIDNKDIIIQKKYIKFIKKDILMQDVPKDYNILIITDTGKSTGKFLGWIL